jgi:predicted nucleic acid-binding protein
LGFVSEASIPMGRWEEAYRLWKGADEKDTPYLVLTLHLDGRLSTGDQQLKTALRAQGFDRFLEP